MRRPIQGDLKRAIIENIVTAPWKDGKRPVPDRRIRQRKRQPELTLSGGKGETYYFFSSRINNQPFPG